MGRKRNAIEVAAGRKTRPLAQQHKRNTSAVCAKPLAKQTLPRPYSVLQYEELAKEDRDIVLDRIAKEIVQESKQNEHLSQSIVKGVNQVTRQIAERSLRVVVFATNVEAQTFAHIPLLCRLHRVPILVLHLTSKALGKVFDMHSLSVFGIRRLSASEATAGDPDPQAPRAEDNARSASATVTGTQRTEAERERIESIAQFLISKASKKSHSISSA